MLANVNTVSETGQFFPDNFLKKQLIAYIGNKRRLLPFLHEQIGGLVRPGRAMRFMDVFAGSGAVSRLARAMNFRTLSNDWEESPEFKASHKN